MFEFFDNLKKFIGIKFYAIALFFKGTKLSFLSIELPLK